MQHRIGELVGIGRVSEVFAYGGDSVIKVPNVNVPSDWPAFEARLCGAAYEAGLPAPEVRAVIEVDGRSAVVFERVHGESMWQHMLTQPGDVEPLARELASIQRLVHEAGIPANVPDFVDRVERRIRSVDRLTELERDEAVALAACLPRGAAMLHGDLHPGNVLMSPSGPVVIDWFDAAIGHPVADIMRSSILMRPTGNVSHGHLPGAPAETLTRLHDAYVEAFVDEFAVVGDALPAWQAVAAVGRLAEGAEVDERGLLAMWASRNDRNGSAHLGWVSG